MHPARFEAAHAEEPRDGRHFHRLVDRRVQLQAGVGVHFEQVRAAVGIKQHVEAEELEAAVVVRGGRCGGGTAADASKGRRLMLFGARRQCGHTEHEVLHGVADTEHGGHGEDGRDTAQLRVTA